MEAESGRGRWGTELDLFAFKGLISSILVFTALGYV